MSRILNITDKYKVSKGYEPAFTKLLNKSGIHRHQVVTADIYTLVEDPIRKRRSNDTIWRFNPDKLNEIKAAFAQRVKAINPSVIVVNCPACLGIFSGGDLNMATLDKMRGGVYDYNGIPVIITYPITAIHQRIDSRIVENEDGESDTQQPYRVPQGSRILHWDWQKVGRFFHGKQRKLPEFQYSICRTVEDCWAARDYLKEARLISTDIETGLFPPQVTCVGYSGIMENGAVHSFVIPFYNEFGEGGTFWESPDDHAIAWSVVREINQFAIPKTMQNGAYDCSYFVRDLAPPTHYLFDSMLMWWSIYMELPKSLDFISSILLDNYQYWKDDIKGDDQEKIESGAGSMEKYWRYCALDCYNTLWNTLYLNKLVQANESVKRNYAEAFMRMLSGLKMSLRGMKADFARRDYHRDNLIQQRDKAVKDFRYLIDDPDFNINSPAQKVELLYSFFGLKPRNARGRYVTPGGKGKNNTPSAGAIPIKMAKSEHPFFKYILEHLESAMAPDKQISNVFGKKDELTGKITGGIQCYSGRFRTAFNAVGTETTRFSSKKSNFWDGGNAQNIRKDYRDWIVCDDNHVILDIDYSQSDDVFMAYESEDPDKIAVVESGLDAHAVNGELFFGRSYDWIVAGKKAGDPAVVHPIYGVRQLSKRIVHGTNFQMAPLTLYVTMGREAVVAAAELSGHESAGTWDQDKLVAFCAHLMSKYRKKYKRLTNKEYYREIADELNRSGKITNAFGTTRQFLGDPNDNGTQREATAFIGQSDTAGNMNRVMYEVDFGYIPTHYRDGANPDALDKPRMMNYDSHGIAFHLQVHDNFVCQLNLKHPKWKEAANNLLYVMNRPVIIKGREVRIRAEAEIGLRWGKGMIEWDGKSADDIPGIIDQLREQEYERQQLMKGN